MGPVIWVHRLLLVGILSAAAVTPCAVAQVPATPDDVAWFSFVGGPGRRPSNVGLTLEPGTIDLGDSAWSCGYGRIRQAAISSADWSVQRVLACRRGEATVSATASCRLRQGRLEEHAATLSLGGVDETGHVTVTLSCRER